MTLIIMQVASYGCFELIDMHQYSSMEPYPKGIKLNYLLNFLSFKLTCIKMRPVAVNFAY